MDSASAIVMFSVKEATKALPAKEAKGVLAKAAIPNKVYSLKYLAEVITPFSEVVSVIFQVIIATF
jgi:phage-related minor tail protein